MTKTLSLKLNSKKLFPSEDEIKKLLGDSLKIIKVEILKNINPKICACKLVEIKATELSKFTIS